MSAFQRVTKHFPEPVLFLKICPPKTCRPRKLPHDNRRFARVNYRFARVNYRFARVNYRFARANYRFTRANYRFARANFRFFPAKHPKTGGLLPKMTENRSYLTESFPMVLQDKRKYRTIFAVSFCEGSSSVAKYGLIEFGQRNRYQHLI
jgi:hypothetical protein